jgi:hypothetical protein
LRSPFAGRESNANPQKVVDPYWLKELEEKDADDGK